MYSSIEKRREWNRAFYQRNKDKIKLKSNQDYVVNKEARWATDIMTVYGITQIEYKEMFKRQEDCCAICGRHQSLFKRRLHVDHNHETGKVRSLLCGRCNTGLGYYEKYKDRFSNYLAIHA